MQFGIFLCGFKYGNLNLILLNKLLGHLNKPFKIYKKKKNCFV